MKWLTCVVGLKATASMADICLGNVSHNKWFKMLFQTVWLYLYLRLAMRVGAF
jgi:hypothetical protein